MTRLPLIRPIFLTVGIAVLGCALASVPVRGDEEKRTHTVTLDDYFTVGYLSEVSASPDGKAAAFVLGRWQEELDRRNSDIWITGAEEARRLTWTDASERSVSWHPNGRELFFIRPHKKKDQVWRMPIDGGEARPITSAKEGVGGYRITHDGKSIFYTSREKATIGEWDWFKKKYEKLTYGSGSWKLGRLWRQDLEGKGEPEKIAEGDYHIGSFDVTRDGNRIAFVKTPDPRLIRLEGWSEIMILDVTTKELTKVPDELWRAQAASPYGWLEGPDWSADGGALAFTVSWDGYPTEIFVAHTSGPGDLAVRQLPRPDGPEISGGTARWVGDSRDLLFHAQLRTRARVYRRAGISGPDDQGSVAVVTPDSGHTDAFSVSADGGALFTAQTLPQLPQEIYVQTLPGGGAPSSPRRLTNLHPSVSTWILPETRVITWKGWNGDDVEGVLSLPAGYDGKEPLPTAVMIHGGPGSSSLSVFHYWLSSPVPLYTAKGWAVLRPNYRGSIGYGDKFHKELLGHKNDRDVADINAGIDWLIEQGIADPERLAVNGWSNGGSLTNWLVVSSPDRFKAAASGAGVADFLFQFGLEDTPGHVVNYSGGFPWEKWELMMKRSPLVHANLVKTPVLFLVGSGDARVPAAHARAFHRSLTYVGVPTELVVFPGEGHGLSKMKHRRAKIELELAWFEKYVLGLDPTPPPEEKKADKSEVSEP
ncbi:MAG: S9 family peptidase [Planctomycetota bacterium]|nr:S9 family peptidase [Planctomycetota bacterium]